MNIGHGSVGLAIGADELETDLAGDGPILVFDLRLADEYSRGHVKGSVHAVCDTQAKETIMPKIPKGVKIILIDTDGSHSAQTAQMMSAYGLDAHYLRGGMTGWNGPVIEGGPQAVVEPEALLEAMGSGKDMVVVDVRQPDEFEEFSIPGSINIPLPDLFKKENLVRIQGKGRVFTVCTHGNRSMVGAFALARSGIDALSLAGGLVGWGQVLQSHVVTREGPVIIQVEKTGKGCLSYIVGSEGQAVVIDPVYPVEKYLEFASREGLEIKKVLDTHHHADHVSAARDLASVSGARLHMSRYEGYDFESEVLVDGATILVGRSEITALHTPGHTAGSLSFVLDGRFVFTGDVLFVDGVGRPDLRSSAGKFAAELYASLHQKILAMPDETVVLPAHHGSRAKPAGGVFLTTIGDARMLDMLGMDQEKFVQTVVSSTVPKPMNYEKIIRINKSREEVPVCEVPDLEVGPNRCSTSAA